MTVFAAVDGGASKTHVLAVGADGRVRYDMRYAGTSITALGSSGLTRRLRRIRDAVVARSGEGAEVIWALGLPGFGDTPRLNERLRSAVDTVFDEARFGLFNDVRLAHAAAFGADAGVLALSGTGSQVLARDGHGGEARCGGWGALFGDEGSAYAIGLAALRCASHMEDGRRPATALLTALPAALHARDLVDAVDRLGRTTTGRRRIVAALAQVVDNAAEVGDEVAGSLLLEAGRSLALQVPPVLERLALARGTPLCYGGGTFGSGSFRRAFAQAAATLGLSEPRATIRAPAWGGVALARRLADGGE